MLLDALNADMSIGPVITKTGLHALTVVATITAIVEMKKYNHN